MFMMTLAIFCFVLTLSILLIVCCYRRKIMLGINIMRASSAFVNSLPFLSLLPILLFLFTAIFTAFCLVLLISFYSLGEPTEGVTELSPFQRYHLNWYAKTLIGFLGFYFLWGLSFIIELCTFLVVGMAVNWYCRIEQPYHRAIKTLPYHLGSMALCAFLSMTVGLWKSIYKAVVPHGHDRYTRFCNKIFCVSTIFPMYNSGAYVWIHLTSHEVSRSSS